MMYYEDPTQIHTLQLDHTSRCNLMCPQCARVWEEGKSLNPAMPIADLTIDDYKILLEPFEDNKVEIFHCGNFGDVIASPTFDETYDYSVQRARKVKIATNGSARKPEWWRDLAQKGGHKNLVIFAFVIGSLVGHSAWRNQQLNHHFEIGWQHVLPVVW